MGCRSKEGGGRRRDAGTRRGLRRECGRRGLSREDGCGGGRASRSGRRLGNIVLEYLFYRIDIYFILLISKVLECYIGFL